MKIFDHDSLLTLAIPVSLEEDILDFLLLHPKWASGFSVLSAQGMGQGAPLQSNMELVHGRSGRKLVLIPGMGAELLQLLQALSQEIPSQQVSYWISPVSASGRLA